MIIQNDLFDTPSVTSCPLTTTPANAPLLRVAVEPSAELPLAQRSWVMVDKITTIWRQNCGAAMGRLSRAELLRVTSSLAVLLGLG